MSEDKERPDHEGSGGHSSERKRHQDREKLREGEGGEPLLDREGEAAEEYVEEERSYSLDPDAKPGDDLGHENTTTTLDEEDVDPSRRRGERS